MDHRPQRPARQRGPGGGGRRPSEDRAVAEAAIAWAAGAGHTATTNAVLDALCAADRDNRAADHAFTDAAGDVEAMAAIVRNQISSIEIYVLRVLAVLGLAVPVADPGSWWARLADQAHLHSR